MIWELIQKILDALGEAKKYFSRDKKKESDDAVDSQKTSAVDDAFKRL